MALVNLREGSTGHRLYTMTSWTVVAAALVYVLFAYRTGFAPGSLDKAFRISQLNDVITYAVAILGLNLVIGYSGQLSIGHSAFLGVGAYTTIILVADHGWSYFTTIPVAMAVCFVLGIVVGLPALRIRGLYLAIVTLSVAYVFPTLVLKYASLTGGPNGKKPPRGTAEIVAPSWTPFADAGRLASPLWTYCILVAIATTVFVLCRNFVRSRTGRALIAIRDNQTSAAVCGVNVPIYKTLVFGASAAIGGLAGSMLMINRPFASDVQFGLLLAIFLVVGLVAGGAGTISGAVPGALLYVFAPYFTSEWTRDQSGMPPGLRQLSRPLFRWLDGRPGATAVASAFFGLVLIVLVFVLPGGVVDGLRRLRRRFVEIMPEPVWLRRRTPAGSAEVPDAGAITTATLDDAHLHRL